LNGVAAVAMVCSQPAAEEVAWDGKWNVCPPLLCVIPYLLMFGLSQISGMRLAQIFDRSAQHPISKREKISGILGPCAGRCAAPRFLESLLETKGRRRSAHTTPQKRSNHRHGFFNSLAA
jgi:hypothetical protein